MKERISALLATVLYTGKLTKAPGTLVSAIGAVIFYLFIPGEGTILLIICGILTVIGIWSAAISEKKFGHDASCITIDELTGMLACFLFISTKNTLVLVISGFIIFRIFDIFKPWPINKTQNLAGGWGVMADDLSAALVTNVLLRILLIFI